MDAKEAIQSIKILCAISTSSKKMNDARDMAIEALEKQVPKAPVQKVDCALGYAWYCPNCGCFIDPSTYNFCQDCGQAIKNDKE